MLPHKLTGPIIVLLPLHVPEALKPLNVFAPLDERVAGDGVPARHSVEHSPRELVAPATTSLPRWCRPDQETTPRVGEGAREGAAAAAVKH